MRKPMKPSQEWRIGHQHDTFLAGLIRFVLSDRSEIAFGIIDKCGTLNPLPAEDLLSRRYHAFPGIY